VDVGRQQRDSTERRFHNQIRDFAFNNNKTALAAVTLGCGRSKKKLFCINSSRLPCLLFSAFVSRVSYVRVVAAVAVVVVVVVVVR